MTQHILGTTDYGFTYAKKDGRVCFGCAETEEIANQAAVFYSAKFKSYAYVYSDQTPIRYFEKGEEKPIPAPKNPFE